MFKKLVIAIIFVAFLVTPSFAIIDKIGALTEQQLTEFNACLDRITEEMDVKSELDRYKDIFGNYIELSVFDQYNGRIVGSLKFNYNEETKVIENATRGPAGVAVIPHKFYHWKSKTIEVKMYHPGGVLRTHKARVYYNYSETCYSEVTGDDENFFATVAEVYDTDGRFMSLLVGLGNGYYQIMPYKKEMPNE